MSQIVIKQQAGPLPIKTSFMWPSSEQLVVAVSASAWTATANTTLSLQVLVDDKVIGTLQNYANLASTHMTLPTGFFAIQRQISQATLTVQLGNGTTTTDQNDFFTVALIF